MYSLAYNKIIQVLLQYKYSGEAHATFSARSPLKQEGRIILTSQSGRVIACFIMNKSDQKLYHDQEAQRLLPSFGVLEWRLVPFTTSSKTATPSRPMQSFQPTAQSFQVSGPSFQAAEQMFQNTATPSFQNPPMNNNRLFYPQKLPVPTMIMGDWPTLQRSVYFLSDGKRTLAQIATLLARPLPQVEQAVSDLQRMGAVGGVTESMNWPPQKA